MRKLSGILVLFLLLGATRSLEAGLTFTAVPGTQVGDNLPVSLFVRADAGESLLSLDMNSIQLSAGTFVQTAPGRVFLEILRLVRCMQGQSAVGQRTVGQAL